MEGLMTIFTFKRRSIVAAISAGVLSLGFAACQSTTETPVVQEDTATKTTTETISSAPDVGEQSQRRGDRARGDGTRGDRARGDRARGDRPRGERGERGDRPRGERGQRGTPPGFDKAAETLGVSSDDLFAAMREAGGRNADLSAVAQKLGVSEEALRAALPTRRSRP